MSEPVRAPVAPGDADATIVLPTPGRRRSPYAPALDRPAAAADIGRLGGLNPLLEAANPVLAVVPQIRHALRHPDPMGLRVRLRDQIDSFERNARAAGFPDERVLAARFALCALLDDVAAATPWGREWAARGFVAELHPEAGGVDRFFTILEEMLERPGLHLDLLEFFYVCLALGFEGKYRSGAGGREALAHARARVFELLGAQRPAPASALSGRWRGEPAPAQRAPGPLVLVVAAALCTALWFAGDALPGLESAGARAAVAVFLGAGWLAWELARVRRTRSRTDALLDGMTRSADPDARAAHELSVLEKRMQEAAAALRKARFPGPDGVRRTVAELPWYIFIGAPGSGKTTALMNAGLRFPLGDPREQHALQGVGGTRNCDWWFTDQAVLLDTAGRYTTQESDRAADAAAWLGFLGLLKRSRPRQPLNGIIVTVSIADLVHWNDQELTRYAGHVRNRVRELYARLEIRLPVYVLVTKVDLLAGFMEFFNALDAEGRTQVWGATFARSELATSFAGRFADEFERLERRLYGMLLARLHEERDLQRRAAIYRFPQQFRGVGPMVTTFLERSFGAAWGTEPPMVRGVYFASGTQEGSPIDRVMATLTRRFNLERKVQAPNVGSGKSYFLRRLLHEVVFAEAGLAGVDAEMRSGLARTRQRLGGRA